MTTENTPTLYSLKADIEHPDRPYESRIAVTFPTMPEVVQVLTDNLGFREKVNIREVHYTDDDDGRLGYWLDQAIHKMGSSQSLQEFNPLALKLQSMDEEQRDVFGAALQSPWHENTLADMINLADTLERFYLQPADAEFYGEVRIDMEKSETADSFQRLERSDVLEDQWLAQYITRLEKCVDHKAYGEMMAKEDDGVFTDFGYLQRVEHAPTLEKESTDMEIPCVNGNLKVGDLVLSAPHMGHRDFTSENVANEEVFSSMVGTVTDVVRTTREESVVYSAVVDFTTPAYSENRLIELDKQLGEYYGSPTTPGVWPPIDVNCAEMRADRLICITDIHEQELLHILDSEKDSIAYYQTEFGKCISQQKPSLAEQLKANTERNRTEFGGQPSPPQKSIGTER